MGSRSRGGRSLLTWLASGHATRRWDESADTIRSVWGCSGPGEVETFDKWSQPGRPPNTWHRETASGCRSDLVLTTLEDVRHTWAWGGDWSDTLEVLRFLGLDAG